MEATGVTQAWRTVDLTPVPGWRAAFLPEDGGLHLVDLLGWAIQEDAGVADDGAADHPSGSARRRVIPVMVDRDGDLQDPRLDERFWFIFGPSDPDPTSSDAEAERRIRAERVRPAAPAPGGNRDDLEASGLDRG
jgi:hypothetical protein